MDKMYSFYKKLILRRVRKGKFTKNLRLKDKKYLRAHIKPLDNIRRLVLQ